MKLIPAIAALVAIVAAVLGGFLFLDTHFAKCAELKSVERRLDYKIENDKLMGMQQRQWQIQEKYPEPARAPMMMQKQMKELEVDVEMQKEKVKKMETK